MNTELKNFFMDFNDLNRNEVKDDEMIKINFSILVLKYLELREYQYNLPSECSLRNIIRNKNRINESLVYAFQIIEDFIDTFRDVFKPYDVFSKLKSNVLLRFLMELDNIKLNEEDFERMTDYLIPKNKEFMTPAFIFRIGIELLNIQNGEKIYDGCVGAGGTLIAAHKLSKNKEIHIDLYGQEVNKDVWALAKLNLFLNGINTENIALGDTLLQPKFLNEEGDIKKFDKIFLNYPLGMKLNQHSLLEFDCYNRFIFGPITKNSGESAFIQHSIASLNEGGKAVIVVSNGVLFRSSEQILRRKLLSADLIDAVIALPENISGSTTIQLNLLILNRNKPENRRNKILFINAVNEYSEDRKKRYIDEENINKINHVYHDGIEINKFSKFVPISEIENDHLLCNRYLENDEVITEDFGLVKVNRNKLDYNVYQSLEDLAEIYRGINLAPKQIEEGDGRYKIIKLSDVVNGKVNINGIVPSHIHIQRSLDSYVVHKDDIIISSRGTNVKVAIVPFHTETLILSQNFLGIRVKPGFDPYFLKAYLESPVGQFLLSSIQTGTNIKNINSKDLKKINVPMVDVEQQQFIGKKYREFEEQYLLELRRIEEHKRETLFELYKEIGIDNMMDIS